MQALSPLGADDREEYTNAMSPSNTQTMAEQQPAGGASNGVSQVTGVSNQPPAPPAQPAGNQRMSRPAAPQTFSQMQAAGQARPAPGMARPALPQQASAMAPGGTNVQQRVQQFLDRPSGFTSDVAQQTFDRLRGGLQRNFDSSARQLTEQMANRGMYGSTVDLDASTRLRSEQARAEADLVSQITERAALEEREGLAQAIQLALGLRGQDIDMTQFDRTSGQRDRELTIQEQADLRRSQESSAELALRQTLGLGDLDLRRQDLGLTRDRMAMDDRFRNSELDWRRTSDARDFDYRAGRDQTLDARDARDFDYTRSRDANDFTLRRDDLNWRRASDERDFNFRRDADTRDFDYRSGRDRTLDDRFADERTYSRGRDAASDAFRDREFDWRRSANNDQMLAEWARLLGIDRFTGSGGQMPFSPSPGLPPRPSSPTTTPNVPASPGDNEVMLQLQAMGLI